MTYKQAVMRRSLQDMAMILAFYIILHMTGVDFGIGQAVLIAIAFMYFRITGGWRYHNDIFLWGKPVTLTQKEFETLMLKQKEKSNDESN